MYIVVLYDYRTHADKRNNKLVGDSLDESEQICQQRVELRRVGSVNAPVGSRRELVANCVHAPPTRLNSTVASRRRRPCVSGTALPPSSRHDRRIHAFETKSAGKLHKSKDRRAPLESNCDLCLPSCD